MTQKMTLLPHCHVAHRGTKKAVLHCAHVRASGTDEMYIARLDHHEKQVRLEDFAPHKPS